ncbi:MAG: hypothetical protein DWQ37_19920 [Planctomycetota bacterium]|nr:MAG: hypothetical protein DWQ37_19920 [Planctomycetota bacterium]
MSRSIVWTLLLLTMFFPAILAAAEDDGAFEVHEISLWIFDPGASKANSRTDYPSALPPTVRTTRGAQTTTNLQQQRVDIVNGRRRIAVTNVVAGTNGGIASAYRRSVAPINVLTFHGRPAEDLDVELRTKDGSFLAHWPPGESFPNRLRWAGSPGYNLVEEVDRTEMMFVDDEHWFAEARQGDALFVRRGTRSERFLAYDAELNLAAPVRLVGGPDEFTVVNQLDQPLYDVLISRHTPEGRRIAWLDKVPPASQRQAAEPAEEPAEEKKRAATPEALFADAPAVADEEPAAADVPAKKDQPADAPKPAGPAVQLFGGLPKDAQERLASGKPVVEKEDSKGRASGAGMFGGLPGRKSVHGPRVTLSEPIAHDSPDATARMTEALAQRLRKSGLTDHEAQHFVERYGEVFFEGEALVVACRLDQAVMDDKIPLSVFPKPSKTVRVGMVLLRDADPQLGEQVQKLIANLGDPKYDVREAAQQRLLELGPLAFPALNKALNSDDPEIVIRAERILLTQNQTPNASRQPNRRSGIIQAAPAVIIQN